MKKKKRTKRPYPIRKYTVQAELSNLQLAKAKSALRLQIFARDEKVGEIEVGRGSLYWYGAHRQRSKRIGWGLFAEMMDELAYRR
jgi:hypothetical protein